jgi:hypothetical protein
MYKVLCGLIETAGAIGVMFLEKMLYRSDKRMTLIKIYIDRVPVVYVSFA